MPCFAEPHKYCLCGVLLMAIENEHKEGIFMRLKKVVIHLAAVTVFCLSSLCVFAGNSSWSYRNYSNGSYVPKSGNMNSSYSSVYPEAYTNVTFSLDSNNVQSIIEYNNGNNSVHQGKIAYLTVDVSSIRDGSEDKMDAYTIVSDLPDPKYDLENDDLFRTRNEESEVVALGKVEAKNYYVITGWNDLRDGSSGCSGHWNCQFAMSQKGISDYNNLTQSSRVQATINYGNTRGQD